MDILIADDHELYRTGLKQLLHEHFDDSNVLEAYNHEQAQLSLHENKNIDVILYDLLMPGKNGFDAIDCIIKEFPEIPLIVLSASDSVNDIINVIQIGAMGFIPKAESNLVIISAIQLVLAGGIYVPHRLVSNMKHCHVNANVLTHRQIEVIKCLVEGKSNKEIARELQLTDTTVKVHLSTIFKLLNVKNRTQAAIELEKLNLFTNF